MTALQIFCRSLEHPMFHSLRNSLPAANRREAREVLHAASRLVTQTPRTKRPRRNSAPEAALLANQSDDMLFKMLRNDPRLWSTPFVIMKILYWKAIASESIVEFASGPGTATAVRDLNMRFREAAKLRLKRAAEVLTFVPKTAVAKEDVEFLRHVAAETLFQALIEFEKRRDPTISQRARARANQDPWKRTTSKALVAAPTDLLKQLKRVVKFVAENEQGWPVPFSLPGTHSAAKTRIAIEYGLVGLVLTGHLATEKAIRIYISSMLGSIGEARVAQILRTCAKQKISTP